LIALSMLSFGMFAARAAVTAIAAGLPSTSPPPDRADIVISRIRRVKIFRAWRRARPFCA
jgi:hypothetical protein